MRKIPVILAAVFVIATSTFAISHAAPAGPSDEIGQLDPIVQNANQPLAVQALLDAIEKKDLAKVEIYAQVTETENLEDVYRKSAFTGKFEAIKVLDKILMKRKPSLFENEHESLREDIFFKLFVENVDLGPKIWERVCFAGKCPEVKHPDARTYDELMKAMEKNGGMMMLLLDLGVHGERNVHGCKNAFIADVAAKKIPDSMSLLEWMIWATKNEPYGIDLVAKSVRETPEGLQALQRARLLASQHLEPKLAEKVEEILKERVSVVAAKLITAAPALAPVDPLKAGMD